MSAYAPIKLQYNPVQTWPGLSQNNFIGAQSLAGRRGTLPTFNDSNTKYVDSVNGSDAVTIAANTTALWKLENDYGLDQGGSYLNLQTQGTVPYPTISSVGTTGSTPPGRYGAGVFSGSNYFKAPSSVLTSIASLTTYTIEFYLMVVSGISGQEVIVGIDQSGITDRRLYVVNSGGGFTLNYDIVNANTMTTSVLTFSTWYKVSVVCDSGATNKRVIYVNAASAATSTTAASVPAAVTTFSIGANAAAGAFLAHGYIKNMRFSSVARTSTFTVDTNTNTGATASPYQSINFALSQIDNTNMATFLYVVVKNSATYYEVLDIWQSNLGLYAADGQSPTISASPGAVAGTYGARQTGRTKVYTGGGTTWHVAKTGTDASGGTHGQVGNPFLTIGFAVTQAVTLDCIQIDDNGVYTENVACGVKVLTFQAAQGKIPVLINNGAATVHFSATNAIIFYGLFFKANTSGLINFGGTFTSPTTFWDCTLINDIPSGNSNYTSQMVVNNCLVIGGTASNQPLACTSFNCAFKNMTNGAPSYFGAVAPGTGSNSWSSFTKCSFSQTIGAGSGNEGYVKITLCTSTSNTNSGLALFLSSTQASAFGLISHSYSVNKGPTATASAANQFFTVDSCITYKNQGIFFGVSSASAKVVVSNCVAIGITNGDAFEGNSTATGAVTVNNCVSLNCTTTGFKFSHSTSSPITTFTACSEYGSSTFSASASYAVTGTSCIFKTAVGANITVANGTVQDPKFLSTASGAENIALNPSSPCLFGSNSSQSHIGVSSAVIKFSGYGTLNGFNVFSIANLQDQVLVPFSVANPSTISYCTFSAGGNESVFLASGSTCNNCLFTGSQGQSITTGDTQVVTVSYCVFQSAVGSGILNNSVSSLNNNSSYGCLYGQYDLSLGAEITFSNSIYSNSGSYDYSGNGVASYSCIGTIDTSTSGSVDSNSTRLNPLFRNPLGGDLRLQVIAASTPLSSPPVVYYFDSPCKLLGSDGQDMGAYQFAYGNLNEAWTTIDFSLGGYRNPDKVLRTLEPVKLAEFVREDRSTESTAVSYPFLYKFDWGTNNDMPPAQVLDLINVYINSSPRVRIDFGSGYNEYAVLKSATFSYEEMGGIGYSDNTVPTPVKNMEFRQK